MGSKTSIEWTKSEDGTAGSSWNPILARNIKTGKIGWHCDHVSEGCRNCYADGINRRLGTGLDYKPGVLANGSIEIFMDETMLLAPLKWKRPRKIFVGSMTDLFARFVTDEMIDKIFAVMALCPQHIFQVLTKRSDRMQKIVSRIVGLAQAAKHGGTAIADEFPHITASIAHPCVIQGWPLPNVWLGISAERQQEADERIPLLLQTPAAVRFTSLEPLLGAIDLTNLDPCGEFKKLRAHGISAIWKNNGIGRNWIDWVIVGGESGPHARPMHPDWARSLRDQCATANVPYFFKQWGQWLPLGDDESKWGCDWMIVDDTGVVDLPDGRVPVTEEGEYAARRVSKKAAGRLLDGVEHSAFPLTP